MDFLELLLNSTANFLFLMRLDFWKYKWFYYVRFKGVTVDNQYWNNNQKGKEWSRKVFFLPRVDI